jgi:hypothetical protein
MLAEVRKVGVVMARKSEIATNPTTMVSSLIALTREVSPKRRFWGAVVSVGAIGSLDC